MNRWVDLVTLWKHQITQLPLHYCLFKSIHASNRSNFTESIMFSQWVLGAKHRRLIYLRKASRGSFFHSVSTQHLIQNRKGKCELSEPSKRAEENIQTFLNFRENHFFFLFFSLLGFMNGKMSRIQVLRVLLGPNGPVVSAPQREKGGQGGSSSKKARWL